MDSINSTDTENVSHISLEEYEYRQFIEEDLIVVSYLVLLSVVGTIGNGHSLLVYSLRYKSSSNHRKFVLWLSVVDLIACCLSIPFEIYDLRYSYTFYAAVPCKIFRFLNHFVSMGSGLLLGVIALERHRKVCRPFKQQIDEKCAIKTCIITVGVAVVLSIPAFVFYGSAGKYTNSVPLLMGSDCTVLAPFKNSVYFYAYSGLFLIISTVIFIICVVAYLFVGRVMYHQVIFRKTSQIVRKKNTNGLSTTNNHENGGYVGEDESSMNTEVRVQLGNIHRKTSDFHSLDRKTKGKKKFVLDRSKRITLMFLVATAVSYVGYLPTNVIIILKVLNPKHYNLAKSTLGHFMSILLRGYFLNNASNPVVYCFLDNRFRTECKKFYSRIHCLLCNM